MTSAMDSHELQLLGKLTTDRRLRVHGSMKVFLRAGSHLCVIEDKTEMVAIPLSHNVSATISSSWIRRCFWKVEGNNVRSGLHSIYSGKNERMQHTSGEARSISDTGSLVMPG